MPDIVKVPDLSQLNETPATGDLIHIVDISDDTYDGGTSKKITWANLVKNYVDGLITTLTSSLSSHTSDTTTHGTTGDIVGTSDSQTLSNKTLGNNLNAGNNKIINLTDPSSAQDSVTKNYVDTPTKSITIPAGSMSPTTTAGCSGVTTIEAATNDVDYKVLYFGSSTDESAFIGPFAMPDSWDGGTINFIPYWTAESGSGTVCFTLKGRAYANDDAIDQAYGTAQSSTDTLITAADVHIGPASSAITLAGSPAGGQLVQLKITRDVSEGTLGVRAGLIAIKLEYGLNAHSD